MSSSFDYSTVLNNDYHVSVLYCGQPMCYDYRGTAFHSDVQGLLHYLKFKISIQKKNQGIELKCKKRLSKMRQNSIDSNTLW